MPFTKISMPGQAATSLCQPPVLSSVDLGAERAASVKATAAAFFLTGRATFWGSAYHVEHFITAVRAAADASPKAPNGTVLVDVGAAPYNTVGGDISHVLTLMNLWGSSSGATIIGFEPGLAPFSRLVAYVSKALGRGAPALREKPGAREAVAKDATGNGEWIVLRNSPASDKRREVTIANQPAAGDNTASLEKHYQWRGMRNARTVTAVTLDGELRRRGLADRELLVLKVDVEGHEMAVLRGAMKAIAAGRVPVILLEYGDKMSPAIWDAMKRTKSAAAAAASPQAMEGSSLFSLQQWASELGYDTYLLGAAHRKPVLIPLTGPLWRDEYEVCRDKSAKWSNNGKIWQNFSAWNPDWHAVCWYDVALVHRAPRSPRFRQVLLESSSIPQSYCKSIEPSGRYPKWIDEPPPTRLCCTHQVTKPQQGQVCHSFMACSKGGWGMGGMGEYADGIVEKPPGVVDIRGKQGGGGRGGGVMSGGASFSNGGASLTAGGLVSRLRAARARDAAERAGKLGMRPLGKGKGSGGGGGGFPSGRDKA